jgi:hypothetical protein
MSGRDNGYLQGSELSVSGARPGAGAGGEEDAPPSPASPVRLARRVVADLRPAAAGWDPVASSMSGEIVPLDDVLGRLVDGLNCPPSRR